MIKDDVLHALRRLETQPIVPNFVFLDPPYQMQKAYAETLDLLGNSKLVGAETVVVAEHVKKFDPGDRFGTLVRHRKLEQGDAALSFYGRA